MGQPREPATDDVAGKVLLGDAGRPTPPALALLGTTPANVRAVRLTGPYRWHRAIGPRLSLAGHGLTFGSTAARGVCLLFREPLRGIDPLGLICHPRT